MYSKSIDQMPNMIMIDERQEKPEEIIQDYFEMIIHTKDDQQGIWELLEMMFNDVNYWSVRQMLIDQAKVAIATLEQLDGLENEFIDEDED